MLLRTRSVSRLSKLFNSIQLSGMYMDFVKLRSILNEISFLKKKKNLKNVRNNVRKWPNLCSIKLEMV